MTGDLYLCLSWENKIYHWILPLSGVPKKMSFSSCSQGTECLLIILVTLDFQCFLTSVATYLHGDELNSPP